MPWIDGLFHGGDTTWQPLTEPEPDDTPGRLPTTTQTFLGRAALLEEFLTAHPIGAPLLGGFIISRVPRNHSPGMMQCEITVARAPAFESPTHSPGSISTLTAQITATVQGDVNEALRYVSGGGGNVQVTRNITYRSRETRYNYFAQARPERPIFGAVLGNAEPEIIRSNLTATAENGRTATYAGASAPAALISATTRTPIPRVTGHSADPILGTPWFECVDVVTMEFE